MKKAFVLLSIFVFNFTNGFQSAVVSLEEQHSQSHKLLDSGSANKRPQIPISTSSEDNHAKEARSASSKESVEVVVSVPSSEEIVQRSQSASADDSVEVVLSISNEEPEHRANSTSEEKSTELSMLTSSLEEKLVGLASSEEVADKIVKSVDLSEQDDLLTGSESCNEGKVVESSSEEPVLVGSVSSKEQEEQLIGVDYYRADSGDSKETKPATFPYYLQQLSGSLLDAREKQQFLAEVQAGDVTQLLGTNPHISQGEFYPDFGRRFVLQYPYKEKTKETDEENGDEDHLKPVHAPPEVVLAVVQASALLEAGTPINPTDEVIQKDSLRTGNYWNAVWQEDVDPELLLRTKEPSNLQSVKAKIVPGSDIYELVVKLKQMSPTLLYVINKSNQH